MFLVPPDCSATVTRRPRSTSFPLDSTTCVSSAAHRLHGHSTRVCVMMYVTASICFLREMVWRCLQCFVVIASDSAKVFFSPLVVVVVVVVVTFFLLLSAVLLLLLLLPLSSSLSSSSSWIPQVWQRRRVPRWLLRCAEPYDDLPLRRRQRCGARV